MARIIDSSDLTNVRRRTANRRIIADFNPDTGALLGLDCYRVEQTRQGGTAIATREIAPVNLSPAELDAVGLQFRSRLEGIEAIADAKEASLNP